jgi:hypothetical protein
MAKKFKITDTAVKSLEPGEMVWDTELTGFMARKATSGRVTFSLSYRE